MVGSFLNYHYFLFSFLFYSFFWDQLLLHWLKMIYQSQQKITIDQELNPFRAHCKAEKSVAPELCHGSSKILYVKQPMVKSLQSKKLMEHWHIKELKNPLNWRKCLMTIIKWNFHKFADEDTSRTTYYRILWYYVLEVENKIKNNNSMWSKLWLKLITGLLK